jgi:hypothetical protein
VFDAASVDLSGDIEAEVEVVAGGCAASDLAHRRPERIGDVEFEHMSPGALPDRLASVVDTGANA